MYFFWAWNIFLVMEAIVRWLNEVFFWPVYLPWWWRYLPWWSLKWCPFKNDQWTFTQIGAPLRTSRVTQSFLKKKTGLLTKEYWPPSSRDINPLDFCLWSFLEDKVNSASHRNIEDLKAGVCLGGYPYRGGACSCQGSTSPTSSDCEG